MPGWFAGSYGYHGDDGNKFEGSLMGMGKPYSENYGKGDVVGCGWDIANDCIFFTKNGRYLGVAFEKASSVTKDSSFNAVVGSLSPGAVVKLNFGKHGENFLFDTRNYFYGLPPNN